jgi:hypothetical protein
MTKPWYTSKTLWTNIIASVAFFVQAQFGWVVSPDLQVQALAILNIVLRAVTKSSLSA